MPFLGSARGTFGAQGRFAGGLGKLIASGGVETTSGAYKIHTFNSNGTFTVTSAPAGTTVDYLMVAGGGGGGATSRGNCGHGGGGAGGLIYRTGETITAGTYAVVIGTGGTGCINDATTPKANALNGNNSTFNGLTALGGGGANCGPFNVRNANDGGSGGGGQHSDNGFLLGGNALQPGSASGGFGFKGGEGPVSNVGSPCWYGGGGGGAGAAGTNGSANVVAPGGIGRQYDISGTLTYYAGGGGAGACEGSCSNSPGGLGGGGTGTGGTGTGPGQPGTDGLGGGGGAVTYNALGSTGGKGGNGVVVIRYTA
jgi:hypothetical protein